MPSLFYLKKVFLHPSSFYLLAFLFSNFSKVVGFLIIFMFTFFLYMKTRKVHIIRLEILERIKLWPEALKGLLFLLLFSVFWHMSWWMLPQGAVYMYLSISSPPTLFSTHSNLVSSLATSPLTSALLNLTDTFQFIPYWISLPHSSVLCLFFGFSIFVFLLPV